MEEYTIGLDIGTNSVGWSVIDEDFNLISKKRRVYGGKDKRKNFWGARLFEEGHSAADRRLSRGQRRRISRRKERICYLNQIFEPEIIKIDDSFFIRLEESFLRLEDKQTDTLYPLFKEHKQEKKFYQDYPTIYHLRKRLVDDERKADLREVYLAIHHILKARGHFIFEGQKLDIETTGVGGALTDFFEQVDELGMGLSEAYRNEMEEILLNGRYSKSKKVDELKLLFKVDTLPKEEKNQIIELFKLVVGNQADLSKLFFDAEIDFSEHDTKGKLKLSDANSDEKIELLETVLSEEQLSLIMSAKKILDAVLLHEILSTTDSETHAKLSASMVDKFENHKKDLKLLKSFLLDEYGHDVYSEMFHKKGENLNNYLKYVEGTGKAKKGKATYEDFYKEVKKVLETKKAELENNETYQYIMNKIELEEFLPKQRMFKNGAIPYQVHLHELHQIIENQKKYYPFLAETYDVTTDEGEIQQKNKIEGLLTFRIPYYVGPLHPAEYNNGKKHEHAWLIKNENALTTSITPWNFDEVVNRDLSSIEFIERMTNFDTYLPTEKVLPKHSMLYEKYAVYNELTKVRYVNEQNKMQLLDAETKQLIFEELFKNHKKVTEKDLKTFLVKHDLAHDESVKIKGIEKSFNASYGTFLDFIKISPSEKVENLENAEAFEEIVKWMTIFEDSKILKKNLKKKYSSLFSEQEINKLAKKHYTGWGRLSAKLIDGIRDKASNKTILDFLIDDDGNRNRNFMQLINDENLSFKEKLEKAIEGSDTEKEVFTYDVVEKLAGSPAIKKGIWQALQIVSEIVAIMGKDPTNIVIEMARENQNSVRTRSAKSQISAMLNNLAGVTSELKKSLDGQPDAAFSNEKIRLYYMQNGKDMYTGEPLDLSYLSQYEVDHIIPQSYIKDDSYNNKVLVKRTSNQKKKGDVPGYEIIRHMSGFWEKLASAGLVTPRKMINLKRERITESDREGFINRQLVETRQIMKHIAVLLANHFSQEDENGESKTKIITLKASLTSQFRKEFGFFKVRELNDYHHAQDAYLNSVVALFLMRVYPDLQDEFVYAKYNKKFSKNNATKTKKEYGELLASMQKEIIVDDNGEILWKKEEDLSRIRKNFSRRQLNIVKKVEEQGGRFTKESILTHGDSDKLLPLKKGLSPKKYGGFDSPTAAYAIPVSYGKGKTKLINITLLDKKEFEANPEEYIKEHYPKLKNVQILGDKLKKFQLYELTYLDENGKEKHYRRMLASPKEAQKGDQFVVNQSLVKFLFHVKHLKDDESREYVEKHDQLFEQMIEEICEFSKEKKLLSDEKQEKMLGNLEKAFSEASLAEKCEILIQILDLTSRGTTLIKKEGVAAIGLTKSQYQYTSQKDIDIIHAEIIHQSITGLNERRIRLWDGE
ncbi:MAG: type II CRISPR RNA-guided endonuclease Cas9 [Lactobacillales bacterium]|jgi:CRISPR-associated endonuclease Csn1|nr:type II CRISPR RNA-guided endonuclease Cas9 [Lactobacillales bacterium]